MIDTNWKKSISLCVCILLCALFTGCGQIMHKINESLESFGSLGEKMHYEEKELGFSIDIPYEWETEVFYADNGGVVRFTPDPKLYGRDDLKMAVLYLPRYSYTRAVENLPDFINENVLGEGNKAPFRIIQEMNVNKPFGDACLAEYEVKYPKGGTESAKMYVVPSGEGLYVLHFDTTGQVGEFIEEAEKAVDSFSISVGRMTPNDYKMAEVPYINNTLGFSMDYIANWNVKEVSEKENGGTVEFLPPEAGTQTGRLTIQYTTEYGLSGAIDAFSAAVKGNGAKVLHEGYVNAPSIDLSYGALCETKGENGEAVTTQLYIIPDEGNACYFAYYSWDKNTYENFQKECEINLQGFKMIGSTLESHVSTGDQAIYPYETEFDFTWLTEKGKSPEDVKSLFGEPAKITTDQLGDIKLTYYAYDAFEVIFEDQKGGLAAAGLLNKSPESPVGIAGFKAGTSPDDADDALRASGYKARKDISTDSTRFYSGKSLDGHTCLVIVYLKNNIVSKAQGWYGNAADIFLSEIGH